MNATVIKANKPKKKKKCKKCGKKDCKTPGECKTPEPSSSDDDSD